MKFPPTTKNNTGALNWIGRAVAFIAAGAAPLVVLITLVGSPVTPAAEGSKPVKIGIIGTGNIGGALAKLWAKSGHELLISSRHPEQLQSLAKSLGPNVRVGTPREAAAFGEVVLISIPYGATPALGKELASELKGKIVLDTGNPYPQRDGAMADDARKRGTGVTSVEFLPGTRLVRAFNAIAAPALESQAHRSGDKVAIPLAGDDAEALAVAQRLVKDAGFDPVVVGGLARAKDFDVGSPPYVKLLTAAELRAMLGLDAAKR
jgi:predicted dinucleotide-binding enzyme